MTASVARRIAQLERLLSTAPTGPAFLIAVSRAEADQAIERLHAEFGAGMPRTMYVMILFVGSGVPTCAAI